MNSGLIQYENCAYAANIFIFTEGLTPVAALVKKRKNFVERSTLFVIGFVPVMFYKQRTPTD
jgi:hypothetical protein